MQLLSFNVLKHILLSYTSMVEFKGHRINLYVLVGFNCDVRIVVHYCLDDITVTIF